MAIDFTINANNGLRNFLFGQGSGLDLPSIFIQRGRDHCLLDYNKVRQFYTGAGVSNFSSITSNVKLASRLSTLYNGNTNNVDLFVGIFVENLLSDTSVGSTMNAITKKNNLKTSAMVTIIRVSYKTENTWLLFLFRDKVVCLSNPTINNCSQLGLAGVYLTVKQKASVFGASQWV